jgi:hypothetical protein
LIPGGNSATAVATGGPPAGFDGVYQQHINQLIEATNKINQNAAQLKPAEKPPVYVPKSSSRAALQQQKLLDSLKDILKTFHLKEK